ncbi:MAG: hypothetical protein ABJG33_10115, partial [Balneola sp.]
MIPVLALDLEGTLISNAVSQIPRPGLYKFLKEIKTISERLVMFTTVNEPKFRQIAQLLSDEETAPAWFKDIDYIFWDGPIKNLNFIPDAKVEECYLIDDQEA